MTQVFFGASTAPLETDLDANFTDLYTATQYQSTSAGQTKFKNSVVVEGQGGTVTTLFTNNLANVSYSAIQFLNNSGGTVCGTIGVSTTATTYGTTSDYRLKANVAALTGSGPFIDSLRPVTFNWISTGTADTGFLAHEFQAVAPSSVTGAKDQVDGQGAPVFQSMQASTPEVIANIIAELQSLRVRVHALDGH